MNEKECINLYQKIYNAALLRAQVFFEDAPDSIGDLAERRMFSPVLLDALRRPDGITARLFVDTIESEFDKSFDEIYAELKKTSRFRKILYEEIYSGLKEFYEEEKSWEKLLIVAQNSNDEMLYEVFLKLVEENTGEGIASYQQLQAATKIYNLNDLDYIKKEIDAPEDWKPTNKVTEAEAEFRVMACFYVAMRHRYRLALEACLRNGGKYPDLLEINPTTFYLTADFQEPAITMALETFIYDQPAKPDLRSLADKINAPYSVILKAKQGSKE